MSQLIDLVIHIDRHLLQFVQQYGAWVYGILFANGFLFGNVPIIKDNFTLVTIGIVIVSVLPMVYEVIKHRRTSL